MLRLWAAKLILRSVIFHERRLQFKSQRQANYSNLNTVQTLHNISIPNYFTPPPPNLLYSWPLDHCPLAQLSAVGHETAAPELNCRVRGCLIGWKRQLVWGPTLHLLRQQIGVRPFVWGGGGGSSPRYMPWQTSSAALRQTDRQTLCIMCGYLL